MKRVQTSQLRELSPEFTCGEELLFNGVIYTLRDAGHKLVLDHVEASGELPFGLADQILFYAGPSPAADGRPFGAIGPTTASRMDFATPQLLHAGIAGTIGKGMRSQAVADACVATQTCYFAAVGGSAALLARCVQSAEVIGYPELGTEALHKLVVRNLPVFVALDTTGRDLYREVARFQLNG